MKLPREKLIEDGIDTLSDDELLAIMLSSGTRYEDVFSMSKRLIQDYGFSRLIRMDYQELSKIPGIKMAKATKLVSIFEIARRVMKEELNQRPINDAKSLFEYVYPTYYGIKKEVMSLICVDSRLRITAEKKYSSDSYHEISVSLKDLIKDIISFNPYGIFLVHNHPGGNLAPSKSDLKYTYELGRMLSSLDIILLDHLIISDEKYYSFSDTHMLKNFCIDL